jgi:hypothetical protein
VTRQQRNENEVPVRPETLGRWRSLLARLGVGGFVFFLIKGLAWLVVPALFLASH